MSAGQGRGERGGRPGYSREAAYGWFAPVGSARQQDALVHEGDAAVRSANQTLGMSSDLLIGLTGGAIGAVLTAGFAEAGRAWIAWGEVTLHHEEAQERNRRFENLGR